MIELAGGIPLLGTGGEKSRRVTWDDVHAAQPDVVVVAPCGYDREGSQSLADDLVASGVLPPGVPVHAVDANASWARPGTRLVDGVEELARLLHPRRGPDRRRSQVRRGQWPRMTMTELPRKAAVRTARLAALPLGYAGRSALGLGKRLGGAGRVGADGGPAAHGRAAVPDPGRAQGRGDEVRPGAVGARGRPAGRAGGALPRAPDGAPGLGAVDARGHGLRHEHDRCVSGSCRRYSEEGVLNAFPDSEHLPVHTIRKVFEAVEVGRADYGAGADGQLTGRKYQRDLRPLSEARPAPRRRDSGSGRPLSHGAPRDHDGRPRRGGLPSSGHRAVRGVPQLAKCRAGRVRHGRSRQQDRRREARRGAAQSRRSERRSSTGCRSWPNGSRPTPTTTRGSASVSPLPRPCESRTSHRWSSGSATWRDRYIDVSGRSPSVT